MIRQENKYFNFLNSWNKMIVFSCKIFNRNQENEINGVYIYIYIYGKKEINRFLWFAVCLFLSIPE